MDYRLRLVEGWKAGKQPVAEAAAPMQPTPPMQPEQPVQPERPPVVWPQGHYPPPPRPEKKPEARDTEYMIGAKLLPKFGAGLVLFAVLSFVAWGYSAGWITPWMVFAGEILFCLGFIAIGQWKRNEGEQFGQILTGIGSCGLYLSLAGGHLVQNLFSGQVLVAWVMALSFANLFYGTWSNSRAFLGIGILGGLASALLPIQQSQTTTTAILELAITVPASLIAAKKRWADMALWLWLTSTIALVPVLISNAPWVIRVSVLDVECLLALGAYAYAGKKSTFDSEQVLPVILLFATALIGFAVESDRIGVVPLALFGIGTGVTALVAERGGLLRRRLLATAIAIPITIAPLCLTRSECLAAYTGLTIACALASLAGKMKTAASFAAIEFSLAAAAYMTIQAWDPLPYRDEAWLLTGMILAAAACAFAAARASGKEERTTIGAMAIIMPFFVRLGLVAFTGGALSTTPEYSVALSAAVFTVGAIAIAARTRWASAVAAMWTAFAISAFAYVYAVAFAPVPRLEDAGLVVLLGLVAIVGVPVAAGTGSVDMQKSISAMAGIVVGGLFMRLTWVLVSTQSPVVNPYLATVLAAAAYSIGASALSRVRKSEPVLTVAWSIFAAGAAAYLMPHEPGLKPPAEMGAMSAMLAAFLAAGAATIDVARRWPEIWHVISVAGWVLFTRWVDVTLSWSGTELRSFSSLTVAWIVYALGLLTLGFGLKVRQLRYWSFAVMFTTISKILLIDLASTSIPFRVAVLLGLGLLMLGGGYWYIKGRHTPAMP